MFTVFPFHCAYQCIFVNEVKELRGEVGEGTFTKELYVRSILKRNWGPSASQVHTIIVSKMAHENRPFFKVGVVCEIRPQFCIFTYFVREINSTY